MYPSFYASATLARNFTPRRPWMNMPQMLFSDYRSTYNLGRIYPNSSLNFTKPVQIPETKEGEFSGHIPVDELEVTYSKSSGPGGQNVNKVNSKVDVRFHVATAKWLSDTIKAKILEKYKNDMTLEGYLIFRSDKTRTQMLNLADCLDKIRQLIRAVCITKTNIPDKEMEMMKLARQEKAARERLKMKRERSLIKQLRQAQSLDE